jgi:hypothetical protein
MLQMVSTIVSKAAAMEALRVFPATETFIFKRRYLFIYRVYYEKPLVL